MGRRNPTQLRDDLLRGRRQTCCNQGGKTGWTSERAAQRRLAEIQANPDRRAKIPIRVYECPHGRYHLTASPSFR